MQNHGVEPPSAFARAGRGLGRIAQGTPHLECRTAFARGPREVGPAAAVARAGPRPRGPRAQAVAERVRTRGFAPATQLVERAPAPLGTRPSSKRAVAHRREHRGKTTFDRNDTGASGETSRSSRTLSRDDNLSSLRSLSRPSRPRRFAPRWTGHFWRADPVHFPRAPKLSCGEVQRDTAFARVRVIGDERSGSRASGRDGGRACFGSSGGTTSHAARAP